MTRFRREPRETLLSGGDRPATKVANLNLVDLVDDLRERARGLFQPVRGNGRQRVHVRVIHGVVDDVEARRIGEHFAEFAARSPFGTRGTARCRTP